MNVIVPTKERRMFQKIKQCDKEIIKSIDELTQIQAHLSGTLDDYTERNDMIYASLEVFYEYTIFNNYLKILI